MKGPPWAPLNAGVFIILLGGVFLLSFFNVGILNLATAFPVILTLFGIWMIIEAFVIPPANAYAPPKSMILVWGGIIGMIGIISLVSVTSIGLLPIALTVVLIMIGIGAVGYSFLKASAGPPKTATS